MSDLAPLVGEPLALDLVNTRFAQGDFLATPEDLCAWLVLQGDRCPEVLPGSVGLAELAAVQCVRECAARAIDCARQSIPLRQEDVEAVNRVARGAPCVLELVANAEGISSSRRRLGSTAERLAAWLAESLVELLTDPALLRIRQCEAEDCVLLFLPSNPRRRWCSPSRCGNRMRVARHYQRHKAG
ncbi:CGNR zinc finger domain-containing protein [Arthrobacter globiformis]|uniref:CGNR zinc finger domain-containing protein n=1 Tax=Arthrobacter globiformis TaxID=1665 RepID=UPI00358EB6C2